MAKIDEGKKVSASVDPWVRISVFNFVKIYNMKTEMCDIIIHVNF